MASSPWLKSVRWLTSYSASLTRRGNDAYPAVFGVFGTKSAAAKSRQARTATLATGCSRAIDELASRLTEYLQRHAGDFGLRGDELDVRYVVNLGGFVSANFTVRDGSSALHVKLARDQAHQAELQHWRSHRRRLERFYRAPPMIRPVEIGAWVGYAFEHLEGAPVKALSPEQFEELRPVLERLHGDDALASQLPKRSLRSASWEYYVDCCREDLAELQSRRPPFLSDETYRWMQREVEELAREIAECPAFDGPATCPFHGDLWVGNLLETPDGQLVILDWDNLALGDPLQDYVLLLSDGGRNPIRVQEWMPGLPDESQARLPILLRATLLTEVVDSLADWNDADLADEHRDAVRAAKQRAHQESLELYRERHG